MLRMEAYNLTPREIQVVLCRSEPDALEYGASPHRPKNALILRSSFMESETMEDRVKRCPDIGCGGDRSCPKRARLGC